ncbi:hypothetical protein [Methylobacterium gnaphalii]|uniref:Uncharacterized protein n=1 Tax=Methylobacterium gnaphalii TaxID=1010610 RepID=A0A512JP09_9HYPH|nr:hypothetical protein [Methylobacterium gnaphalii]GEP11695.1 hypothetical protein MGN01_35400 [Methylobacterium gnaphalii]GJD68790.1 hypothetical protein MMMDOFMJ_1714 [Methylobacterium gnaphalii]GLS50192.1 hypothetical protein GCM10007885_30440 [Methylobacterium gnaphalii]
MAEPEITFPQPVEFGRRQDDSVWISFGTPFKEHLAYDWPGTLKQASDIAQALNAIPQVVRTLRAVQADIRAPDTDTMLSRATGELIEEAFAALGVRP